MPAKRTHRRKVKKITQPRANSKKKRKQSRTTDTTQSDSESEEAAEADVDPEAMAQQEEQRRIADEGLLRERMRRVRETEPEMFDDYALSDDSENENHGQEGAPQSNNQESGSEAIGDDDPSAAGIQDTRLIESDEARTDSSQGLRVESVESPSGSEHLERQNQTRSSAVRMSAHLGKPPTWKSGALWRRLKNLPTEVMEIRTRYSGGVRALSTTLRNHTRKALTCDTQSTTQSRPASKELPFWCQRQIRKSLHTTIAWKMGRAPELLRSRGCN
jgi:hypothetical protein